MAQVRRVIHKNLTANQSKRRTLRFMEALTPAENQGKLDELRAITPAAPAPRAPSQRREAPILKDILRMLRTHPLVQEVWRQSAGQIPVAGGFIRLGDKGKLDIAFRLKDGRYGEIEVKAPGKRPMPHQQARIDYLQSTGAVAGWADSIEKAKRIIDNDNQAI